MTANISYEAQITGLLIGFYKQFYRKAIIHGRTVDSEPRIYLVYDLVQRELETAMLVDSAGFPVYLDEVLTRERAVSCWIRGFEAWNEKCPGLYRLKYSLVKD